MDELLKQVTAKTGMSAEQVKPVVDSVLGFLKEKLPGGLGGHIDSLLGGGGANLGDVAKNLGGLFGGKPAE
jgi:hypothetical protein